MHEASPWRSRCSFRQRRMAGRRRQRFQWRRARCAGRIARPGAGASSGGASGTDVAGASPEAVDFAGAEFGRAQPGAKPIGNEGRAAWLRRPPGRERAGAQGLADGAGDRLRRLRGEGRLGGAVFAILRFLQAPLRGLASRVYRTRWSASCIGRGVRALPRIGADEAGTCGSCSAIGSSTGGRRLGLRRSSARRWRLHGEQHAGGGEPDSGAPPCGLPIERVVGCRRSGHRPVGAPDTARAPDAV
mmetsp:Transcript_85283/g.246548  ORF Transcript_85283/g.246548 Transcript_85283/m.246548 type:complete len:245 (-) Transcript_85283:918-1652(-)